MSTEQRPAHHTEILGVLEEAAYGVALLGKVEALAIIAAREVGIAHADLVIGAVRERARRRAHKDSIAQLKSICTFLQDSDAD